MAGRIADVTRNEPVGMSFDELIAGSPLPHILLDAEGMFRACSETWLHLVPDSPSNIEIVMAHTMGRPELFSRALKGETIVTPAFLIRDEQDKPRWIRIEFGPASYRDGRVAHIVGHGRDVTEEEEARRELERSQVRLNAALGMGRMVVQDVNDADRTFALYGDCPELREGLLRFDHDLSHVHPDDRDRIRRIADEDFAAGGDLEAVKSVEFRLNREPPTWVSTTYQGVAGPDGRMESLLLINQDITDKVLARQELERVAFTDALTGLPNRARFQLEFEKAVQEAETHGRSVGLVMVDVDHFKDINDTLGHDAGDALLKALASEMRKAFRSTDIVARLGGDEFAILLQDISTQADLVRPLKVLSEALQKPLQFRGQGFRISTSVGAALHDDPEADATHLLKNADIALYHAKEQGRDRTVVFQPQMRSEVEQRLELLRDVRAAIPRGEFVLFYQPVVSLAQKGVTGFEALMRWNHPDHGVLPPSKFQAALEDQDLSLQLGDVTIETALKQMRAWLDQGLEFGRVSINLSPSQFRTGRLAEDLDRRLRHWGVPANRLTVEVTENVYIGWGTEIVSQTVRDLHSQGVSIALDDFGTGYASLANLRQFPIDRLKIDKSFVQNAEDDAIVRAVINLGASMGMEVVAEGVEKPEQLSTLSRYGCEQVQGFHFARPMPAVEVPSYLQAFKAAASPRSAA